MTLKENLIMDLSIMVVEDNLGDFVLIEDYLLETIQSVSIKQYPDFKSVSDYLLVQKGECDLILLDLHLPDMNGLELIKSIIAISHLAPIIVLTGYADQELAKRSLALGVYDFLVKDEINPTLLHKSIEFALSRCSYVRQIEIQNEKLRNIAWSQSHEVRAPLARILGIMNLIEENCKSYDEILHWLKQLRDSTNEMDEVVQRIVNETQTLNNE